MIVVGSHLLVRLIAREKRKRPQKGRTLDRRAAAWKAELARAAWRNPMEAKAAFGSADPVGRNRIVFDLCGNSYRVVARVDYAAGIVEIRFAGDHEEYDRIDARTI